MSAKPFKAKHGLDANNQEVTDVADLKFSNTDNSLLDCLLPQNQVLSNPTIRRYSGSITLDNGQSGHTITIPIAQGEGIYIEGVILSVDSAGEYLANGLEGVAFNNGGVITFRIGTADVTSLNVRTAGSDSRFRFSFTWTDTGADTFTIDFANTQANKTTNTWDFTALPASGQ